MSDVKILTDAELIAEVPRLVGSGRRYWTDYTLQLIERRLPQYAAAITRLASQSTGWRPIEEAPKDGGAILLTTGKIVGSGRWREPMRGDHPGATAGFFFDGATLTSFGPKGEGAVNAMWMPLPSPPQS